MNIRLASVLALGLLVALLACNRPPLPEPDPGGELEIRDDTLGTPGDSAYLGRYLRVDYIGRLASDSTIFDQTVDSLIGYVEQERITSELIVRLGTTGLVEGFEQGLIGMKVGGVRTITIPPRLGYGTQPPPGIPVNATLVFTVKLNELR